MGIILIILFLIYQFFNSFSLSGSRQFPNDSLDSKQFNSFIYGYQLENNTFIIENTEFKINEVWVAHDVYSTDKKNRNTVYKSTATFYISLTNNSLFYKNYLEEYKLKILTDKSSITFGGVFCAGEKCHLVKSLNEENKEFIKNNIKMELILVKDSIVIFNTSLTRF